ncbi:uncharacterized protein PgNI_08750 [Pyricularia grisea]|uniref:Uncharacterized protein n=1 Tax=Pyricularia grisea TaxID=148305 RepID=A0A6P8AVP6_PYRGI|nr:uncharacterized protein PgNI_08750 [Pyricularia grisea]TLD06303.1 hypothetical protein PgNI_08750 [Pyricularia grisea]
MRSGQSEPVWCWWGYRFWKTTDRFGAPHFSFFAPLQMLVSSPAFPD